MDFNDMKRIWDAQNKKNIFVINEEALHRRIIKDKQRIKRNVNVFEWTAFFTMAGLSLMMIVEGLLDNELYQIPEGILLICSSFFIYWNRYSRKSSRKDTGDTLLSDIDKSIQMINYHIKRQRYFVWWFTTPIVLAMIIHFVFTYTGKPWWLWVLAIAFFIFQNSLIRKEIRCKYMPRKNDLESLRAMLLDK